MRVLVLTTSSYGANGGIAQYNRDMIEAIAGMPAVGEVVVVPRLVHMPTGPIPAKVRFVEPAARGKRQWLASSLWQLFAGFQLVICGHINLLPIAGFVAALCRVPMVLIVYGIDVWTVHPSVWVRRCLRCVSVFWSTSVLTRDKMRGWCDIPVEKFAILPNAIHLEQYGIKPRNSGMLERYNLRGRKVLLTLARLAGQERYKGIDEVLEILPQLLATHPDLVYVIAGDGEDRDRLQRKALELGLSAHVTFAGFVNEAEKADLYRLADVFVMPGRGEGFGFVFLEALACGVPVVGSELDGSKEALRDGELGQLANPDCPESIVTAIQKALQAPREIPVGLNHFAWPAFRARLVQEFHALKSSPDQ